MVNPIILFSALELISHSTLKVASWFVAVVAVGTVFFTSTTFWVFLFISIIICEDDTLGQHPWLNYLRIIIVVL